MTRLNLRRAAACVALLAALFCASWALAEKPVTYYTLGDTVTHGNSFAYEVLQLTADGQVLTAQLTLYALEEPWVLTKTSFVLMDAADAVFYPDTIGTADGGYQLADSLTIPAGQNCTLVFHVPFQQMQAAQLYWVCCDGADSFSCLRFLVQPAQAAGAVNGSGTTATANPGAEEMVLTDARWAYSAAYGATEPSHNVTGEPIPCTVCRTTGICSLCGGKGILYEGTDAQCDCPACRGSGDCPYCGGTGTIDPQ